MTEDTKSNGLTADRRTVLGVLAAGGVLGTASASSSTSSSDVGVGGGPMSDELAHLNVEWYEGDADEVPEPGVEGRFFKVLVGNELWDEGDVLEDTGDSWRKISLGVESLRTEYTETDILDSRNQLRSRQDVDYRTIGTSDPLPTDAALMTDISSWDTGGDTTTEQSNDSLRGDHSIRASTTSDPCHIDYTFESPVDLSNRHPVIAVKVENPTDQTVSVQFRLREEGLSDYVELVERYRPDRSSEWRICQLGIDRESGTPDINNIERMDVRLVDYGGGDASMMVDDIRFVPTLDQAYCMFIFDDSNEETYDHAFPALQNRGWVGIDAVVPEWVEEREDKMSIEQLTELYEAGWALLNHHWDHSAWPPTGDYTFEEWEQGVTDAKEWLLDHGFRNGQSGYIYVGGRANEETRAVVDEHHDMAFGVEEGGGSSPGNYVDPLRVARTYGDNVSDVESAVDLAVEYNMMLPFYFHEVGGNTISVSDFERILDYIEDTDGITPISYNEFVEISGLGVSY